MPWIIDGSMSELQSAPAVIEALGGLSAVAALTGSGYKAVANWKSFGAFPPRTYVIMTTALNERGLKAPASLWGMVLDSVEAAE